MAIVSISCVSLFPYVVLVLFCWHLVIMSGGKQRCFYSLLARNHSLSLTAQMPRIHTLEQETERVRARWAFSVIYGWETSSSLMLLWWLQWKARFKILHGRAPRESSLCTSRFHVRGMRLGHRIFGTCTITLVHIPHSTAVTIMKVTSSFGSFLLLAAASSHAFSSTKLNGYVRKMI
jgi:hypothetical protein